MKCTIHMTLLDFCIYNNFEFGFYYLETELCKGVSMVTGVAYPKSDGSS